MPTIEKVFDSPGPQPNGMQATEDGLWILDQQTNEAHLVSYDGVVKKTLDTGSDRGSGITDTGDTLWLASTYSCEILSTDPESGKTLTSFETPVQDKQVHTAWNGATINSGWRCHPLPLSIR